MFRLGPGELILIIIIVVLVFGPKRLPELGKGIGQFFINFKEGMKSVHNQDEQKDQKTTEKEQPKNPGQPS